MCRSTRFVDRVLVPLLLFFACRTDAKFQNYGRVLESPDYREALSLLAPQKMFTNFKEKFAVYADEETWLNSTCSSDLITLDEAIVLRETWALTMFDASSKLQSGLLQGNLIDLGQYDECMAVRSEPNNIRGRHCMYSISATQGNVTIPINPTLSVCLPASCSASDIEAFFNATISWIDKLKDLKIKISSATCSPIDPIVWDVEFTICLSILAGFITFLVACTAIELSHRHLDASQYRHPLVSTLAMFSLRKSASSILNMEVKKGTLPAIHGIRFLSMAWVVLGHEFVLMLIGVPVNTLDFLKWVQSWKSLYIFVAPFAVDTFFAMSGFLMTYLFLKQMPKQKTFNLPMYYLHRYFRLTPSVIALLVFTIVFIPKLGSGARWDTTLSMFAGSCRAKWWPSLLYVQNFVNQNNMCLGHLWYLAVDMQFFWVSSLILYPLHKKPKFGLMILAALFLASLAVPATVIGIRQLPVSSFTHSVNINVTLEVFQDIYTIPYHRAGPWLVGIFVGHEVATHNRRLNKRTAAAGWLISMASFAFCIFGTRSFMDPDYEYNAVWETFFSAVSRPIWAIGVCWIIYASIKNYAGILCASSSDVIFTVLQGECQMFGSPIWLKLWEIISYVKIRPLSSILSSKIFLPLSRLSYCVYLVHIVLQTMHAAGLRTPTYFSDYYVWRSFFSTLMISVVAAFFFSLLFESPIMVLEKMLLKRKRESRYESQKELRPNEEESQVAK